uniref:ATP synthase complex subunit 8 n=1 Tax=Ranina ranina TaxID=156228 RepID=A0A076YJ41_RANRA|nr:ATPase subunit 8 [Ranina ranina]
MPQMAPLLWLYLFSFFLISLFLFMIMNYFITPYSKVEAPSLKTLKTDKDWKW